VSGRRQALLAEIEGLKAAAICWPGLLGRSLGTVRMHCQAPEGLSGYLVVALPGSVPPGRAGLIWRCAAAAATLSSIKWRTGGSAHSRCGGEPWVGLFARTSPESATSCGAFTGQPDFYADPWKLRRSIEASGQGLLEDCSLQQGRPRRPGQQRSRNRQRPGGGGSPLQSSASSTGRRFQTLVMGRQPERLGEWRAACRTAWAGFGRLRPNRGSRCCSSARCLIEPG